METYLVFTAVGVALAAIAIGAVVWAIRSGQYDDLETPALRALVDDAAPRERP